MQDKVVMVIFPSCPHCGKNDVAFYLSSARGRPDRDNAVFFFTCGNCGGGVCAEAPDSLCQRVDWLEFSQFRKLYPEPEMIRAPAHTPDNIAAAYKTALKNLRSGEDDDLEAACIMARRSIELAVKRCGGEGRNLRACIDDLAEKQIIAPSLQTWAHEIRDIGNEGAHDASVNKEDAEQAVYFAEMLFTYLFTMPAMIDERRKSKSEG